MITCKECKWWNPADGTCHKHAPIAICYGAFPNTQETDWCGDAEEKDLAAEGEWKVTLEEAVPKPIKLYDGLHLRERYGKTIITVHAIQDPELRKFICWWIDWKDQQPTLCYDWKDTLPDDWTAWEVVDEEECSLEFALDDDEEPF